MADRETASDEEASKRDIHFPKVTLETLRALQLRERLRALPLSLFGEFLKTRIVPDSIPDRVEPEICSRNRRIIID